MSNSVQSTKQNFHTLSHQGKELDWDILRPWSHVFFLASERPSLPLSLGSLQSFIRTCRICIGDCASLLMNNIEHQTPLHDDNIATLLEHALFQVRSEVEMYPNIVVFWCVLHHFPYQALHPVCGPSLLALLEPTKARSVYLGCGINIQTTANSLRHVHQKESVQTSKSICQLKWNKPTSQQNSATKRIRIT